MVNRVTDGKGIWGKKGRMRGGRTRKGKVITSGGLGKTFSVSGVYEDTKHNKRTRAGVRTVLFGDLADSERRQ